MIPSSQLLAGQQYTHAIELYNSNIRHFPARFRRRTKVMSEKAYMADLSLRLYHHLHDNKNNLRPLQKGSFRPQRCWQMLIYKP